MCVLTALMFGFILLLSEEKYVKFLQIANFALCVHSIYYSTEQKPSAPRGVRPSEAGPTN